jgi:hypothetical protein
MEGLHNYQKVTIKERRGEKMGDGEAVSRHHSTGPSDEPLSDDLDRLLSD